MARPRRAVAGALLLAAALTHTAHATATGGVAPPRTAPSQAAAAPTSPGGGPVVSSVETSATAARAGAPMDIRYQVDGRPGRVEVRIYIRQTTAPVRRRAIRLGRRTTNAPHRYVWKNKRNPLRGALQIKVWARDARGRRSAKAVSAQGAPVPAATPPPAASKPSPSAPAPAADAGPGVFPIAGAYSYPGPDGSFGNDRGDHIHQGQDISAAEGVPVVAVTAGTIVWRRFQAGGAGNYLVLRSSARRRDYVYMHLKDKSTVVSEGQAVSMGQQLAQVGSTGHTTGPHLHFEAWEGRWYDGGRAVDPMPYLRAWERR